MAKEIVISFREIPIAPGYFISKDGIVLSTRKLKGHIRHPVRQYPHMHGGYCVDLTVHQRRKKFKVHRLVACTYLANPQNKKQVNHLNGDRYDNRLENLEWVTDSENKIHSCRFLKHRRGGAVRKKAIEIDRNVPLILKLLKRGIKQTQIAKRFNVTPSVISRINTGSRSMFKSYKPQTRVYK